MCKKPCYDCLDAWTYCYPCQKYKDWQHEQHEPENNSFKFGYETEE